MACAYAKYTGRLGVCLATSGPGAIHLLNGLYDAKMDQAPVLAITGMTYHDLIGTHYQQDVNTDYLFQDVAALQPAGDGPGPRRQPDRAGNPHARSPTAASPTSPFRPTCRTPTPTTSSAREMDVKGHTGGAFQPPLRVPIRSRDRARRQRLSRASARSSSWPAAARAARPTSCCRSPERLVGADRQAAAGQGRRARRQPLHHRRRRPAGHQAVRGGACGLRRAADGRHLVPVHELSAQAGQRRRRPDRRRSGTARPALSRSRSGWRATRRRRCASCCRCCRATTIAASWSRRRRVCGTGGS